MDPTLDPFEEPPKNIREYFGEDLANALDAKANQKGTHFNAVGQEGCIVELFGGPLDGAEAVIAPGSEFACFNEGTLAYRFCAKRTVARGRETWVHVVLPPIKG